jgi:hypothetical protein
MYSLTCPHCQASISVSPAQAGDEISCQACGNAVRVPKLGELRQLPRADEPTATEKSLDDSEVGGRNMGFVFLGSIATICLLVASFCGIRWAMLSTPITTAEHIEHLRNAYKVAKPAELIREWESMEKYGVDIATPYNYHREATEKRGWGTNAVIAGGIGALCILAAWGLTQSGRRSRSKVTS